jgi:hypothetical protein
MKILFPKFDANKVKNRVPFRNENGKKMARRVYLQNFAEYLVSNRALFIKIKNWEMTHRDYLISTNYGSIRKMISKRKKLNREGDLTFGTTINDYRYSLQVT